MKDTLDDKEITWATVNLDDEDDDARFEELELRRAVECIKRAVGELHNSASLNEQGELVNPELPRRCCTALAEREILFWWPRYLRP